MFIILEHKLNKWNGSTTTGIHKLSLEMPKIPNDKEDLLYSTTYTLVNEEVELQEKPIEDIIGENAY